MAKCEFSIEFTGDTQDLVNKAGRLVAGAGGRFEGNANSGSFELKTPLGSVKGNYKVNSNTFHISVTQKPLVLSCSRIEQELHSYLAREA